MMQDGWLEANRVVRPNHGFHPALILFILSFLVCPLSSPDADLIDNPTPLAVWDSINYSPPLFFLIWRALDILAAFIL